MLLYYLFWMLMGFILHFYIIFGAINRRPNPNCCFCLFQCFIKKEYQMESKRNETFGSVIFGTNMIQGTWSGPQATNKAAMRQGGAPTPPGRALHPRGPLVAPPTYFFLLYIPTYPENIRRGAKTLFPLPQPSIPVRSHLGAFSGAPPEGALIMEGFYINTMASPMMCE